MELPLRIATIIGKGAVMAGAVLILVGALGPWAQVVIFKNIQVALPGFVFLAGGLCLSIAALTLLGAHRSPILCVVAGLCVFVLVVNARRDIPHQIKRQLIGAQIALSPVNRLLNQFRIDDIDVGAYNAQDGLLGAGLTWASWGGGLLLLGGATGLPGDPIAGWVAARAIRRRCSQCGARWLAAREANYCPDCGARAPGSARRCRVCQQEAMPADLHCIGCGTVLTD